jgi:hypothetical protein
MEQFDRAQRKIKKYIPCTSFEIMAPRSPGWNVKAKRPQSGKVPEASMSPK